MAGQIVWPRIAVRKPFRGDIHPLTKQNVSNLLRIIPIEYLYGLRRVELRPRQDAHIGQPFGIYWPSERTIILYSLPLIWRLERITISLRRSVEAHGATVEGSTTGIVVRWPNHMCLSVWYWMDVFMHELGHHFSIQFRHKNPIAGSLRLQELRADQHAGRYRKAFISMLAKEKNKQAL